LHTFDIPEGNLIELGESIQSFPADTIFYALVERGMAVTREARRELDPSIPDAPIDPLDIPRAED
jgi:hypothetical protein